MKSTAKRVENGGMEIKVKVVDSVVKHRGGLVCWQPIQA